MRFVFALIALFGASSLAVDSPSQAPTLRSKPPDRVAALPVAANPPDALGAFALVNEVNAYLEARAAEELAGFYASVQAELDRQAAARAVRPAPAYHPGTTDGECGPVAAIVGWAIVNRESGGNPSAYNPSGAYGCSQTLLSHYNGGVCSGLDPYTIAGQAACTQILYDRGGLAPWAY